MSNTGIIYGVNGPVIYLKGDCCSRVRKLPAMENTLTMA